MYTNLQKKNMYRLCTFISMDTKEKTKRKIVDVYEFLRR